MNKKSRQLVIAALCRRRMGGIETRDVPNKAYHTLLFRKGVCLIENLTNLGALTKSRVMVSAPPLVVEGLEAIPLHIIAL